jgi:hypothetical protein
MRHVSFQRFGFHIDKPPAAWRNAPMMGKVIPSAGLMMTIEGRADEISPAQVGKPPAFTVQRELGSSPSTCHHMASILPLLSCGYGKWPCP